eukprot:9312367-Alexandrium_andersonii.AAC.1
MASGVGSLNCAGPGTTYAPEARSRSCSNSETPKVPELTERQTPEVVGCCANTQWFLSYRLYSNPDSGVLASRP